MTHVFFFFVGERIESFISFKLGFNAFYSNDTGLLLEFLHSLVVFTYGEN